MKKNMIRALVVMFALLSFTALSFAQDNNGTQTTGLSSAGTQPDKPSPKKDKKHSKKQKKHVKKNKKVQ